MTRGTRVLALCLAGAWAARVDRDALQSAEASLEVDAAEAHDAEAVGADGQNKIVPLIAATRRVDAKLGQGDLPFADFLDFSYAFEDTLGALGSAFKLGKKDFSNNIRKMNDAKRKLEPKGLAAEPTCKEFLQAEKSTGIHKSGGRIKDESGVAGMLWIRRSCQWVLDIMAELVGGSPELYDAAKAGYDNQLAPYHGWLLRKVFGGVIWNLPTKEAFCRNLLDDPSSPAEALDAACKEQMRELTEAASPMMEYLVGVFVELDLEDTRKI